MNKDNLRRLLNRISSGDATAEEIHMYNDWINAFQIKGAAHPDLDKIRSEMLPEIHREIRLQHKRYRLRLWTKIAAAAAVLLVLALGGYYFQNRPNTQQFAQSRQQQVVPGGNKAVLTLANGQRIVLQDVHNGQLARQGNCQVTKADSGLLIYQSQQRDLQAEKQKDQGLFAFNTLTTARGGQFRLVLPDGTKVWLNSASSIRYPAAFNGKERRVAITGEAYFEVAHDTHHPFVVTTRHSDITVLGTRFNIMAYDNEPAVATTLLEGAVKISLPGEEAAALLRPGQQASVENASHHINVKEVDAAGVSAWIHGLLSLKDCSVRQFMNQLSRWYDVDVKYTGAVPQQRFGGMINRNAPLQDVLAALETAGIQTILKGRTIIVSPH